MDRFRQLQRGDIFWNEIREYVKEREKSDECIFCGSKSKAELTIDHLLPRSLNGPDDEKNIIWLCQRCNSQKGSKRLYEYWTVKEGLEGAKYNVPRIAEGKYLKLIYETLQDRELLNLNIDEIRKQVCPKCDLKKTCIQEKTEGKLSPLCLDGILTLCFR